MKYQIKAVRMEGSRVVWCEEKDAEFFGLYRFNQVEEQWEHMEDFPTRAAAKGDFTPTLYGR